MERQALKTAVGRRPAVKCVAIDRNGGAAELVCAHVLQEDVESLRSASCSETQVNTPDVQMWELCQQLADHTILAFHTACHRKPRTIDAIAHATDLTHICDWAVPVHHTKPDGVVLGAIETI
eukprot:1180939-Prorocentrum_minimum.AAC.5